MTSLEDWCATMETSSASLITLANVICDVENGRVDPVAVKQVVERLEAIWKTDATPDAGHASDVISDTLNKSEDTLFCLGPPIRVAGERLSRVADKGTLIEFYIYKSAFGMFAKPHVPKATRPIHKLKPKQIRRDATVRGKRPVAWITKSDVLEELERHMRATPDRLATYVRDHLGLDYLRSGDEIIEIRYPDDALDSARVAAPTFIEGACRNVYRSTEDKSWGQAVDLDSLKAGGLEAVHTPIKLTADFDFHYLGRVVTTRVCIDHDLEAKCPRRWRKTDVALLRSYI